MDKGLTRYLRGRGRIALAVAVSLVLVLALPTLAFAVTWGAPFPTGTLHTTAQLVGVNAFSSTALDVRTASITIDGVSQAVAVNVAGASTGDWAITEIGPADDGSYRIRWTWTAAVADTTKVSLSCAPAGSAATTGTHNVVASIGGVSTPWTYVVARTTPAPIPPSSVTATTVAGCECHPGFQTSHHHGDAVCADCHTGVNAPAHGDPYGSFTHVILPTASMDTTNQACVASGCHSRDLVTAHNNASCWSSSCHASYDVGPGQPGCPCHGAAKGRPTGDLAHNMSAATLNNGATLQCTTCHNTPNHMGHTPVNYYGAGQRAGEPPLHRAITAATVDSQNQGCINCHGVGGSVDLALVHWNGKSKLSGCFCHDAANYTNNAVTSSGQTFKFVIDAGRNGSPVYCTDCHSWADVQDNHGAATTPPVHAAIAPPSSDTTDTACVSSGCHSSDLVTAHNNSSCWSASCHVSYGSALVPPVPAACPCHGAAAGRPTGDLALNMKNATISGGAGLVCTTCHNTPNHMGHEPANYYYPGSRAGEPALHAAITTLTVNASSAGCVQCHGNGDGTADLALVHWNGGEALGGCFCHANSAYAAEIASGVGGAHVSCTDAGCHDLPTVNIKHGNQSASAVTHTIMVTASMDTTNQACVASGCHDTGLVAVHNNSACASCHGAAPYNTTPNACFCHEAAAGRPTGDLATNMLNGLNSVNSAGGLGSTVECTTCHNTPNHMGHTPVNYYGPGQRQGEPPLHKSALLEPFQNVPVLSATEAPGTWFVDRYAPAGFTNAWISSVSEWRLKESISAADFQSSGFYNTQGRGFDVPNVGAVQADLCVDTDWTTGTAGVTPESGPDDANATHRAGIWGVGTDNNGNITTYAIIDFINGTGFRCWDNNGWHNIGYPAGVWNGYGQWYTLKLNVTATSIQYLINGTLVYTDSSSAVGTLGFKELILEAKNFNNSYDVYWDNVSTGQSAACVACHGSDLPMVHSANPSYGGVAPGCICHTGYFTGDVTKVGIGNMPDCVICHEGPYAAHTFTGTEVHGATAAVSGHNTPLYPGIGAREDFSDTLHTIETSATKPTGGQILPLTTEWPFPTHAVFWGDPGTAGNVDTVAKTWFDGWNAAHPTQQTTYESLDKESVITCQDCHTGLNTVAGPHGASDNFGIDPAYPGDYNEAELTKWIVTNPSGIKVRAVDSFFQLNAATGMISTCPSDSTKVGTTPYYSGMPTTDPAINADGQNHGIICSKCHQLEVPGDGYMSERTPQAEPWMGTGLLGTTLGIPTYTNTGAINTANVGGSNVAHGNAHQDTVGGHAQCVDCHLAIPHAWKRPRLLVNSGPYPATPTNGKNATFDPVKDPYPYLSAKQHGTVDNGSGTPGTVQSAWGLYPTLDTAAPRGMESLYGSEGHELVDSAWGTSVQYGGDGSGDLSGPYTVYTSVVPTNVVPVTTTPATFCMNSHRYMGAVTSGKPSAIAGYPLINPVLVSGTTYNATLAATPAHNTNYTEWAEMQCEGCNHNAAHENGTKNVSSSGSVSMATDGNYTETVRVKE